MFQILLEKGGRGVSSLDHENANVMHHLSIYLYYTIVNNINLNGSEIGQTIGIVVFLTCETIMTCFYMYMLTGEGCCFSEISSFEMQPSPMQ